MNLPNVTFWSHLLTTVGVEVCGVAVLGFVAQLLVRSAVWKRAIWQMTVICLLLLPASEWTGFGRGAAAFLFGHKRMMENVPTSGFTKIHSAAPIEPITAKLQLPPTMPQRPVWWPAWFWLAGTVIVLGRMAAAQVLLLALRWRREKITSQSLRSRVAYVARSLGLRRKVGLLWMPESISPMAFGIVRPSIGLPPGFEAKLSATEQEAVLAHELAHLAAMDPLWFLLADFASACLWWHPLVWWVRGSLHGAAELAADEATALLPDGPGALANCLVNLGKEMREARGWSWVGINGGFRSKLGQRVERLMRMSGGMRRPLAGWAEAAAKIAAMILVVPTVVLLFGSFQSAQGQKADTLRGQLRDSWNSSPGAVLVLAALDDAQNKKVDIAARLQKGKLLYQMHKYDEAEAILLQIVKDAPTNHSAPYYLDLIKDARYMDRARQRETAANKTTNGIEKGNDKNQDIGSRVTVQRPKVDIAALVQNGKLLYEMDKLDESEAVLMAVMKEDPANRAAAYYLDLIKEARFTGRAQKLQDVSRTVITTKERQYILAKLHSITLDEVSYDLPLKDVLARLQNESQKRDPDGFGINFIIFNGSYVGLDYSPSIDLNPLRIKISPPMRHVRLADVLGAIVRVADSPIRYRIEDYAVVFSPKPADAIPGAPLYSRMFRVDPKPFVQNLEKVTGVTLNFGPQTDSGNVMRTNRMAGFHKLVVTYFAAAGVDLAPPKYVFFNDRLGELLVRATLPDLDIIEQAIEAINRTPPQVSIEARFVELSQKESRELGRNSYLGSTPLSNDIVGVKAGAAPPDQAPSTFAEPSGAFPVPVTLVPGATPNTSGSVVVTATAFNGILSDSEFRLLINAIEHRTGADILAAPKVTTESGRQAHYGVTEQNNGVALDVIAEVGPDGFTIQTAAMASIKKGAQTWQFSASHKIWDGQTLVFSGAMTNQIPGATREVMVFVTPRIIDPAGNTVHTDEDISKRPGIPNQ